MNGRRADLSMPGRALRTVGAAVAVAIALAGPVQAQTVPMPPEYKPVRDYIDDAIAKGVAPSVALAVVKDGKVIWAEGFGLADREKGIKATADTIYLLASGSKPITATGLMTLVDKGLIDLDKPANAYLPGARLRAYVGSADDITVRRVASHSSGLAPFFNYVYPGDVPLTPDEAIARYGFSTFAPGSQYAYSNLNYATISAIVEHVAKQPWRTYQEKAVYDPLGMTRTSDRVRPGHEKEMAVPYLSDAAGRLVPVPDYTSGHQGASHIRSTANDLARFALMHLGGGAIGPVRILSDASVKAMQTLAAENPPGSGMGYGLGWMISPALGRPTVRHDGGMPGVATVTRLYQDDHAATIVLTNTSVSTMVVEVTTRLGRVLVNRPAPAPGSAPAGPPPPPPPPPPAPIQPEAVAGFAGTWQGTLAHFDGDIAVRVVVSDKGEADVSFGGRPAVKLTNVTLRGTSLRGQVDALLSTRPGFHGIPSLSFRLERSGDGLTGLCTATVQNVLILPHWVHLTREPAKPGVPAPAPDRLSRPRGMR